MSNIRVAIVARQGLAREEREALLSVTPEVAVVAEAATAREGLLLAWRVRPDVVVIEPGLPDMKAADAIRLMLGEVPTTRVLVRAEECDGARVREAFRAGAEGYVWNVCGPAVLAEAIRSVAAGEAFLGPG